MASILSRPQCVNTVNLHQNVYNRHPIICHGGVDIECLWWAQIVPAYSAPAYSALCEWVVVFTLPEAQDTFDSIVFYALRLTELLSNIGEKKEEIDMTRMANVVHRRKLEVMSNVRKLLYMYQIWWNP